MVHQATAGPGSRIKYNYIPSARSLHWIVPALLLFWIHNRGIPRLWIQSDDAERWSRHRAVIALRSGSWARRIVDASAADAAAVVADAARAGGSGGRSGSGGLC
jgi:hypothetical protein